MLRPPEDLLDAGLLAAQRMTLERDYALAGFVRLADSLARPDGGVQVRFRFHAAGAFPAMEGVVRFKPWLVCQRCLQVFEAELESPVRVAFVGRDAEAGRVPEEYDAVTAPGGRIDLVDLVEDELLLALPLVPMHAAHAACAPVRGSRPLPQAAEPPPAGRTQRPFGDLRALMKRG